MGQRKGDGISTNRSVGWLLEGSHQLPSGPMGCPLEEPTEDLHMFCQGPPPPGNNCFAFWTMTYHSHFLRVTLNPGFSVQHARRLTISTRALLTSQNSPSGCFLAWTRLGLNIEPTVSAKCSRRHAEICSTSTTEQAYHRFIKGLLVCNRPHRSRQPASDPLWAPCLLIRHFANEGIPVSGSLD